jgi:hypothetical protein
MRSLPPQQCRADTLLGQLAKEATEVRGTTSHHGAVVLKEPLLARSSVRQGTGLTLPRPSSGHRHLHVGPWPRRLDYIGIASEVEGCAHSQSIESDHVFGRAHMQGAGAKDGARPGHLSRCTPVAAQI